MIIDADREVVERVLGGEQDAFRLLVEAYQKKAFGLAVQMLKDDVAARDAVQEAFVRAYRGLSSFKGNSTFATWFYRIVYTTCLNVLRSQRRMPVMEQLDEESEAVWIEPEIFDEMDRETIESVLQEELERMSPTYAAVLDLFYVKDCSYAEIVRVTGTPLGTVKTRLNRGRTLLKEALLQRLPELKHTEGHQG